MAFVANVNSDLVLQHFMVTNPHNTISYDNRALALDGPEKLAGHELKCKKLVNTDCESTDVDSGENQPLYQAGYSSTSDFSTFQGDSTTDADADQDDQYDQDDDESPYRTLSRQLTPETWPMWNGLDPLSDTHPGVLLSYAPVGPAPGHSFPTPSFPAGQDVATTTVMLQNVPKKISQQMLILELNGAGFDEAYDFVYLPIVPDRVVNRGYAFINFISPGLAAAFIKAFEGKIFSYSRSDQPMSVKPATIQGFDANFGHFTKGLDAKAARPFFLRDSLRAMEKKLKQAGLPVPPVDSSLTSPIAPKPLGCLSEQKLAAKRLKQQKLAQKCGLSHSLLQKDAAPFVPAAVAALSGSTALAAKRRQQQKFAEKCGLSQLLLQKPKSATADAGAAATGAQPCNSCGGNTAAEFKFCMFCGSPAF